MGYHLLTVSLHPQIYKYFQVFHICEIPTLATSQKCEHTFLVFLLPLQHVNHPVTTNVYNSSYCTERFFGYSLYLNVLSMVGLLQKLPVITPASFDQRDTAWNLISTIGSSPIFRVIHIYGLVFSCALYSKVFRMMG